MVRPLAYMILVLFWIVAVVIYPALIVWAAIVAYKHNRRAGRGILSFLLPLVIVLVGVLLALLVRQQITDYLDRTMSHGI
jgi:chromate transport protein ChrA